MFNEKANYPLNGDMMKSVYDTDNDGVVDAAESVPWEGVENTPTTLEGYGIDDSYTKAEVNELLDNVEIDVDDTMSDTSGNPVQNKVVKAALDAKQDKLIFDDVPTSSSNNPVKSGGVKSALDNKVDAIPGKGLSTEDFTTNEKNKLSNIAAGAEVNVNADLNATSGDAQILNNPFSIIDGILMVTYTI